MVGGARTGYRHRARLAVRGRASRPVIGIFEAGSHRAVDIPNCLVHHPLVNDVARALGRAIRETQTSPYSDAAHAGLVRYVQIVVERPTRTAQVVVVVNAASPQATAPLFTALREALGPRLQGLFWNGNAERTNTILGAQTRKLAGADAAIESIGGVRVFFPPGAFGQNHLDLADSLVAQVHAWVPGGSRVLELYAGVGAIGLGLAAASRAIAFNELAPGSLEGLALGLAALDEGTRARTRVLPGPAEEVIGGAGEADVVIVDPPRKGLGQVRERLLETPPSRLVYVACGLASFLDDARAFAAAGALQLRELVAFDLFPHTEHVEIAARFDHLTAARR